MEGSESRTLWTRLGALEPKRLGLAYVLPTVAIDTIATFFPSAALALGIAELALLIGLIAVVAFLRDDEPLDAGVLIALITGVAGLATAVLVGTLKSRSLAPLVMMLPSAFGAMVIRGLIWGVVGMAVVWLLRRVRRKPTQPRPGPPRTRRRF